MEADRAIEAARDRAARLLNQRLRSTAELRASLLLDGHPAPAVEAVIARLSELGLLDDARFAAAFVRDGVNLRSNGRFRLRRELRAAGVDESLIDQALDEHCPAEVERETVDELAAKRAARLRGLPTEVARRRLAGQLERRGFAAELVAAALDRHFPWSGLSDEC